MKERPILFSGPMVRAILDGRKSQTRRGVNLSKVKHRVNAVYVDTEVSTGWSAADVYPACFDMPAECIDSTEIKCPYGQPGDRLWVRETWAYVAYRLEEPELLYRADYKKGSRIHDYPCGCGFCASDNECARWNPSIHMPRWASRITLEITNVRVERLQDISEADAIAEGVEYFTEYLKQSVSVRAHRRRMKRVEELAARLAYQSLWDSINAKRGYSSESNPWVWVVEFKKLEANQ